MNDVIISKHAKERLLERRNIKHWTRHENKIKSWNLPQNGIYMRKGWRYVIKDNVLLTVLPPKWSQLKKLGIKDYKGLNERGTIECIPLKD